MEKIMQKDTDRNDKLYIFLTYGFWEVGGSQWYVKSKTEYLQKNGWTVLIICSNYHDQKSCFPELERIFYRFPEESISPIFLTNKQVKDRVKYLLKAIPQGSFDSIVIESCDECTALWAELLAKEINAKHLAFILNESFRGERQYYEKEMEFFKFKLNRRELAGITSGSLKKLFDGYVKIADEQNFYLKANEGSPVQDIYNEKVDSIVKADWNICSLGRFRKPYIPYMLQGICDFAKKYPDKSINFITVGDTEDSTDLFNEFFSQVSNVNIIRLGVLNPIPRSLYSKVDVVIAMAGCARLSAYEHVPTLSVDVNTSKIIGILGYSTMNTVYHDENDVLKDYVEALEDVLVDQSWKKLPFRLKGASYCDNSLYEKHFRFIAESVQTPEYFDVMSLSLPSLQCKQYRRTLRKVVLRNYLSQFPIGVFLWNALKRLLKINK